MLLRATTPQTSAEVDASAEVSFSGGSLGRIGEEEISHICRVCSRRYVGFAHSLRESFFGAFRVCRWKAKQRRSQAPNYKAEKEMKTKSAVFSGWKRLAYASNQLDYDEYDMINTDGTSRIFLGFRDLLSAFAVEKRATTLAGPRFPLREGRGQFRSAPVKRPRQR